MRTRQKGVVLLATLSVLVSACGGSATSAPTQAPAPTQAAPASAAAPATPEATFTPAPTAAAVETTTYPRDQTLYTSGKQWGAPSTWNPLDPNAAMGVVGLQYETLFLYDPLTDKYSPWLAAAPGSWDSSKTTYTLQVRDGIQWTDGQPFTAKDVAFTLKVMLTVKAVGSPLPQFIDSATATDDKTVVVKFKGTPSYQEWAYWLYNNAIIPEHIWSSKADENILKDTNQNGVGTGPYMYKTAAEDRMVWVRNDNWWGKAALGLNMGPTYIVDMVNGSNSAALGQVISGNYDLNNNYLPGIASIVNGGYGVSTYFNGPPYMLAGNTATLIPNTKKKPLDDAEFRKALYYSINVDDIVNKDYGNIVTKSDPTGLLPIFDKYVDKTQRDAYGYGFNTDKAKQVLAAAGYKTGSDGCVTNKDGSPIKLTLEVPDGWSDWMVAENLIAQSAKKAGICIDPQHPDYNTNVADRNRPDAGGTPKFDLVINNDVQVGNTPWTWYDYVFRLPLINGAGENRNFEGYEDQAAWTLVQQLDQTPVEDLAGMQAITSKLQKIQLDNMPVIPLWYNGVWSQVSNAVWTNWPSDKTDHILPATWNGYWQMGAVLLLAKIQPVKK